jgi:hypothetical protein
MDLMLRRYFQKNHPLLVQDQRRKSVADFLNLWTTVNSIGNFNFCRMSKMENYQIILSSHHICSAIFIELDGYSRKFKSCFTWLICGYTQSGGFFFGLMLRQLLFAPQHLIIYIFGDFGRTL